MLYSPTGKELASENKKGKLQLAKKVLKTVRRRALGRGEITCSEPRVLDVPLLYAQRSTKFRGLGEQNPASECLPLNYLAPAAAHPQCRPT